MQMELHNMKKNSARGTKTEPPPKPHLNLYGPPNLNHILGTSRRFIFRQGVPLNAVEFKDVPPAKNADGEIAPSWQDENLCVWAMPISPVGRSTNAQNETLLNSKKRVFDEAFNNFVDHAAPADETPQDRELRYDRIRKSVVNHMFDSDWKFDTLVEQSLAEVRMGAAVFVRNPQTHSLEPYKGPMPGSGANLQGIKVFTRTPWPGALVQALPPTEPALDSVCYILRTHSMRGKFDPKKAVELGVPRGPSFAVLTRGENVVNSKGETITSDMVLGPPKPGQGVAILDVPSIDYLEPLFKRAEWSSESVMQGIQAFIWNLGAGVLQDPTLQQFMKKMGHIQHIVSSPDLCPNRISMDGAAVQTIQMGQIDPDRYHVPVHDNTTLPQVGFHSVERTELQTYSHIIPGQRGLRVKLMPNFEVEDDAVRPALELGAAKDPVSEEVMALAKKAQKDLEKDKHALERWRAKIPHPDTEVITLGTGSALPSKYRNVSATLVRVPGIGNYLFDAGENTLGQLRRVFDHEELIAIFQDLRMIWISHLHADHHLGITSVIKAWYSAVHNCAPASEAPQVSPSSDASSDSRLAVISDEGMLTWLHEYSSVEDFGYSRLLPLEVSNHSTITGVGSEVKLCPAPLPTSTVEEILVKKTDYESLFGFSDIQACAVQHCRGAQAVSITFPRSSASSAPDPLKISYSGDCRPSHAFAKIGHKSTVLIHEATFDDELRGDALAKKHSTTSEALGVGAKMEAKAVVLTHFSQRYQKFPILETVEDGQTSQDPSAAVLFKEKQSADVLMEDRPDAGADIDMNVDIRSPTTPPILPQDRVVKVRVRDMKVAVAFDYMRVKIGDIAQLEKFIPALTKHFATIEEVGEDAEVENDSADEGAGQKNGNGKTVKEAQGGGGSKKKAKRHN
jgi:ribonuclease Z